MLDVFLTFLAAAAFSLTTAAAAQPADSARIGLAAPPTSFDPHYQTHAPSYALQRHVFEPMLDWSPDGALLPLLARDWAPLPGGDGWEFHLDPAARFQDGSPVTAGDVAASLQRARTLPNSPSPLTPFFRDIRAVEVVDARTLRLRSEGPVPLLPTSMTTLLVVPARLATAGTAAFNDGSAAIGSGAWRLARFRPGEGAELTADPGWWRPAAEHPAWRRLGVAAIPQDAARVAALLAGDVALIEAVPPRDVAVLEARDDVALARAASPRLIYIALDQREAVPEGLLLPDGTPPARNPLADMRVRRALSLAIDRGALVGQVMQGQASATGQLLPADSVSADPDLPPPALDRAEARRLLAEAGVPRGFRMVLAGPQDRFVNDAETLQAVAQMWRQVGVVAEVQVMPNAAWLPRFVQGRFGASLSGWLGLSGEPQSYLTAMLASRDHARGRGSFNPGGYASPALDALIDRAVETPGSAPRQALWRQAVRLAVVEDAALLPLLHGVNIWAMRRGLAYPARRDGLTLGTGLRPAAAP
ncbi:ABC transporter substrate-binding protein [Teichococcus deserti]|uniref:ABC transporter substrate-binding protein n=1 Tax=Teichococcus deserti TaxID=1817963 RepID=UPI0013F678A7|nr:ABC transporter substrate-binding protein [Pseudoroseomonas deserti]